MAKELPDYDYLHARLLYNVETGELSWKRQPETDRKTELFNNRCAGKIAGRIAWTRLYRVLDIDGRRCYAHRIIWKMMTGNDPVAIDHIDRDGLNNAWSNLRQATPGQNLCNTTIRTDNASGVKGVSKDKNGWVATISINGKLDRRYFATKHEAQEWRKAITPKRHGEFACSGDPRLKQAPITPVRQRGVGWNKSDKRWAAYIQINGRKIRLGNHKTYEGAVAARRAEEQRLQSLGNRIRHPSPIGS